MTSYANEHDSTTNNSNTTTTNNNTTAAAAATGRATALAGTGAGFGFNSGSGSDSVVMHEVITPPATATARVAAMLPHKLHHSTTLDDLSTTHGCLDYYGDGDSSSLSDGREKADTTPENIKKIDDLIEQQQQQQHQHQQERYSTASTLPRDDYDDDDQSPAQRQANSIFAARDSHTAFGVGLAAAVDDSGVEFCLAKPAAPASATTANTAFRPACLTTSPGSSDKEIICKSAQSQRPQQQNYMHSNNITSAATTAAGNYNNHDSNKNEHDSTTTALQSGSSFSEEAHDDDSTASQASNGNTTTAAAAAARLNKQQSLAFTIDSFNDKESDPAAQAAKYKSMMERFQNRHRRGASLSKLELAGEAAAAKESATLTSSASATPLTYRNARNASNNRLEAEASAGGRAETAAAEQSKVKLRARDRSTSRVRDAAKRHSWSPRSSTQELSTAPSQTAGATKNTSAQSTQKALPPSSAASVKKSKPAPLQMPKGAANLLANRTHFTPRSTAMQMALQKVDFLCPQPPLADFKHLQLEADDISETGTYTLDGDNYTEEQKDLMNIDRNGQPRQRRRPKALDVQARESQAVINANATKVVAGTNASSNRCSNVLEVNYYHEEEQQKQLLAEQLLASPRQRAHTDLLLGGSHQSAGAYLEQIKSRVLRHVSSEASPPKVAAQQAVPTKQADTGCFTSVTTSGVLAKQGALDARPKLTRRSSLSTSQIDSSEYVSNEAKLQAAASAYAAGGYTDHQKAEYRLNVFTNQKDSSALVAAKFAATRQLIASPPDTPTSKLSDTAVLKTAQTKHDWIQEWARNARARSLASDNTAAGGGSKAHLQQQLMTRSYTCASDTLATESLTDDSIYSKKVAAAKLNKTLVERYRLAGADCDYASDPALSSAYKPPKSPTKIPSPLHSLGRARSASRSRPPLQNMLEDGLDAEEASVYLQKTASAISNLQQSLSGKNSLKSPTNSNSPRAHSARGSGVAALYSPEECSPQHSLDSPGSYARQRRSQGYAPPRHTHYPQQQQLMTSSINEQQLQLLTSGEYLMRQMRLRKNSFDGNVSAGQASPGRKLVQQYAAEAAAEVAEQQSLSPLRRSSSYSTKIATKRAAQPQYQNIYTPPAARHNYTLAATAAAQQQARITKSASSNNFPQMYSDYDEHLQYYINDEDDMEDERQYECEDGHYYSSGGEEEDSSYYEQHAQAAAPPAPDAEQAATPTVPLSNTRYNKALLMRIERSKQKVSGATAPTQSKAPASVPATRLNASLTAGAGLVACPNTPELPRRSIKSATSRLGGGSATARQSMPREASLSRLARQVPSSLASAKKQLLQTAAAGVPDASAAGGSKRVQPKYLDISKYKPAQGNAFLRKNDAKSTLKQSPADAMRRSPSSSSMAMSRADPTRNSNRSARSIAACMTASGTTLSGGYGSASSGRAASAARRDASVAKQKEAEMAMWKRRSTYDPMKAAAEDRRKKEEAKRLALSQSAGDEMPCESETTNTNSNSQRNSLEQEWQLDEQEYGEDEEF